MPRRNENISQMTVDGWNGRGKWINFINDLLKPPPAMRKEVVLDLFAGCGGLALGFESVGFKTIGYEIKPDCVDSYNTNLAGCCHKQHLCEETEFPSCDIIIGGPPCQPFSVGGHQLGLNDSRDGFPAFISAVNRLRPRLFLFENVRGILYKNRWYYEQIKERLESFGYIIEESLLNAVDYGVPQNRERVVVVGHRGSFSFPSACSRRVNAGEALGELANSAPPDSKWLTESMDKYIMKYEIASCCKVPRDLHLDRPSRTVTCRNLAGATGDMHRVRLADGRRRRISVREAARLQSFPDWFEFKGSELEQYNQVGNAVAPLFGRALALSVVNYLNNSKSYTEDEILSEGITPKKMSLF